MAGRLLYGSGSHQSRRRLVLDSFVFLPDVLKAAVREKDGAVVGRGGDDSWRQQSRSISNLISTQQDPNAHSTQESGCFMCSRCRRCVSDSIVVQSGSSTEWFLFPSISPSVVAQHESRTVCRRDVMHTQARKVLSVGELLW